MSLCRERKVLSEEGVIIAIIFVDPKKLTVKKSPDIISRDLFTSGKSQNLISRIRIVAKQSAEKELKETGKIDIMPLKKSIQKNSGVSSSGKPTNNRLLFLLYSPN